MIDFLLTDMGDGVWRFRRDPTIVCARERAFLQTDAGIPFLAPELCLLYKSKYTGNVGDGGKNQADFEVVHREMGAAARAWLRWALLATEPGHPWIDLLV